MLTPDIVMLVGVSLGGIVHHDNFVVGRGYLVERLQTFTAILNSISPDVYVPSDFSLESRFFPACP